MRYTKWFASIALMAGMTVAGTGAASAAERRNAYNDNNRVQTRTQTVVQDRVTRDRFEGNRFDRDRRTYETPVRYRVVRRDVRDYCR
jgi:hypothetical protein